MFEKFDEAANDVLATSRHECIRLRCGQVLPEHLLLALTRDPSNLAARSLATMNLNADNVQQEVERAMVSGNKAEPDSPAGSVTPYEHICFSDQVKKVFERANDFRLYFGRDQVAPEHLLLGMVDMKDDGALQIIDELGGNLTFLRRQVMNLIAREDSLTAAPPASRQTVVSGISELIWQHLESVDVLKRLADASDNRVPKFPDRGDVVLMVFLAYLPDFLLTQVAYQRYLLEETLRLLVKRSGTIDKEVIATIVSTSAQNLRAEVRRTIEHLWAQENRMLSQMLDEAEHEEIGSIIEDLWWTHSEEIALHEVFDEALDDYRRKHVLNLQKRKLELAQRLTKLRQRLEDTVKQCFLKRSLSA